MVKGVGFSLVPKDDFLEKAGSEENRRKEKTLEQQRQDGWNWKPLRELARLSQRCGTRQKLKDVATIFLADCQHFFFMLRGWSLYRHSRRTRWDPKEENCEEIYGQ